MPILSWRDEFNVNVKKIDAQHQKMLDLVNNLHTSVEACIDKEELKNLLIELVEFTSNHFSTEEKLMKEYAYPAYAKHHREHRILIQHMNQLVAAVSDGKSPTFYSDYDVSSDWALVHITEYDKDLGAFLNSKDVY